MRREKKDQILAVLPEKIRGILLNHGLDFEKIQEIRLREEQPLAVKKEGKEELFTHRVTKEELRETMEYVSNYSLYAYENELRQGFLTIEGGHRVGISGNILLLRTGVHFIDPDNVVLEIDNCPDNIALAVVPA